MSHSANVKNAAKLGYTRMGKAICMCRRCSANRAKAVSTIANTRQKSHAGKNEPRMSMEGDLEQLARRGATSRTKSRCFTHREPQRNLMASASFRLVGLNRRLEMPGRIVR